MEKEILKAQALKKKTGQEFFPLECFIALHWKHFHRTEHFFFNISISLWLSARLALTLSLNLVNLFWWTSVWMPRSFLTLSSMISTSSVALRSWCLSTEERPSLNFWYSVAVTTFWFSNRLIRLFREASSCFSFSKHWTSTFLAFSVLKKYSYTTHFKWTWTCQQQILSCIEPQLQVRAPVWQPTQGTESRGGQKNPQLPELKQASLDWQLTKINFKNGQFCLFSSPALSTKGSDESSWICHNLSKCIGIIKRMFMNLKENI